MWVWLGNGLGIEFDGWNNNGQYFDPSANHVALVSGNEGTHLVWKNDMRTEDYKWHDVIVKLDSTSINVYLDGGLEIS